MSFPIIKEKDKVLLICDSANSFMVKAIKDGITNAGYECQTVINSVQVLSDIDKPEFIFLYLDENVDFNSEEFIYIRDFCVEDDKKLFLVGYDSDIVECRKIFPDEVIAGTFKRPIDARAIGDELNAIVEKSNLTANKKHILVVDDSGTMLRTIRDWLSDKYKVSVVNSATSAISFLATNYPDLVLLDYEMPICSGPQMLQMIRSEARTANLPVIFLTAHGERESVQNVLELKPDGYLLKTMSHEKIVASIDSFFQTQKAKKI